MTNDWRIAVAIRLFGTSSGYRLMSFVGVLSVSGLALAVAVLVTVLSVVNGFERELRERVLGVLPHGGLYARERNFDWQSLRTEVLAQDQVVGAAPNVEGSGLAIYAGEMVGVQFRGISAELEPTVSILPDYMSKGSLAGLAEQKFGVVLGAELAESLGAKSGEQISLILPSVNHSLAGTTMTTRRLTVAGTFQVGADIDKNFMLLRLEDAMKLKRQNHADSLTLRFADLFQAPQILHQLSLNSSQAVFGVSWMRQNGNLYDAIQTQKATMFMLLLILVAVAAFNLVSNLVMTVDDNRSEIAILKTMGASRADLRFVFIVHGFLVCLVGLGIGLTVGIALTSSLSGIYAVATETLGLDLMSEYFIRYLPTDIRLTDLGAIGLVSFIICLLATIFPASRAANANPVEVLAHEH